MISGDRWMFMWRSAPESWSFTRLVSQRRARNHERAPNPPHPGPGELRAGERFGAGGAERSERILVEFISANPTGPMHVGHARNAAYGDSLARMLELHGHRVEREFYVNDAGSQVSKLGASLQALVRGEAAPEDGYKGAYVADLAERIPEAATM